MTFSQAIYSERKRCGYSLREYAENLGVSLSSLRNWEKNQSLPGPHTFKQIQKHYVGHSRAFQLLTDAYVTSLLRQRREAERVKARLAAEAGER